MASESRNPAKHTYIYAIMSVCRGAIKKLHEFRTSARQKCNCYMAKRSRSRSLKGQTLLSRTSEHSTWNWIGGVEWGMTAETMPDDDLPRSRCRSRSSQGASEQFIFIHICIYLTRRCGWGCAWWCCCWRRCDDDLQLNESRICGLYALTFPPLNTHIHTHIRIWKTQSWCFMGRPLAV